MTAVFEIGPERGERRYRIAQESDKLAFSHAREILFRLDQQSPEAIPDELLPYLSGIFNVHIFGICRWRDLFNDRQLLTIACMGSLVRNLHSEMLDSGRDPAYCSAISAYLGLLVGKAAGHNTCICRWEATRETITGAFSRQALGMVWDYVEANAISGGSGSVDSAIEWITRAIRHCASAPKVATVNRSSAAQVSPDFVQNAVDLVITDPPYYDSVPYADLSDFFYVWAKRSLGSVFPDIFATVLSPKRDEAVQLAERNPTYAYKTKERFEKLLTDCFRSARQSMKPDGVCAVMFAHKSTSAWETLLTSLLEAGLVATASWPLDTEMGSRLRSQHSAALASSVLIICRPITTNRDGLLGDVESRLHTRLHERLEYFWNHGIRGADFFMSAIGPAIEVFGANKRVLRLDATEVSIGELLRLTRRIVADYAIQRLAGTECARDIDDLTQLYVIWRWAYGTAEVESGEAIHMAQSMGLEFASLVSEKGMLSKKGDKIFLKGPSERQKIKNLGAPAASGVFAPRIDVLHRSIAFWSSGEVPQLIEFLSTALPHGAYDLMLRLAQSLVDVLSPDDKERATYENFLVGARSVPDPTLKDTAQSEQRALEL